MASFNSGTGIDFVRGCTIDFDPKTGLSEMIDTGKRYLSQMRGMYADDGAFEAAVNQADALVYEFHTLPMPEQAGDLSFGSSIVKPGKVGDEYYMTKGHFHTMIDTAEVYYCMSGHGYMMMENADGDWLAEELLPGHATYVPRGYGHRSINVDPEQDLVTFFVYPADAGHDYGTIETKGFRKLLVERNGVPTIIDNPKWV